MGGSPPALLLCRRAACAVHLTFRVALRSERVASENGSPSAPAPPRPAPPRPQVDMSLYHNLGGHEKLVASCTGIFKKLGALRAL